MPADDEIDFKFLAEQSVDVICLSGFDRLVRYISPSCYKLLGWRPEELVGKGPEAYVLAEDLPLLDSAGARILASENQSDVTAVRMQCKDGAVVWVEINVRLVRDPVTGDPKQHVIVMRDITERKNLEERLTAQALCDGLTGLLNRRALDEALEREWRRSQRDGSQLSLLLLDIDHFKRFNDRYGHQAGDERMRAVAATVSDSVRATDVVARYGGDELAVVLPNTDHAGAVEAGEKVRTAVERLRASDNEGQESARRVTVSIGVATTFPPRHEATNTPQNLLLAADTALYAAKREGRNRVATALRFGSIAS